MQYQSGFPLECLTQRQVQLGISASSTFSVMCKLGVFENGDGRSVIDAVLFRVYYLDEMEISSSFHYQRGILTLHSHG